MKRYAHLLLLMIGPSLIINSSNHVNALNIKSEKDDSASVRLLIINAFDAGSVRARKNKKELVHQLADTLKQMLADELQRKSQIIPVIADQDFVNLGQDRNVISALQKQYGASRAIAVKNIDVYFEQKEVEVLKDEVGTHRNAAYDINSVIDYAYYDNTGLVKESSVRVFHYFSTRSVLSGLFAAGPNIVNNREDAFKITRENVSVYFRSYFPC
jgi:hypothetical protein